ALYQRLIARIDMLDVSATFVMEIMKETTEIPLGYV
ncbi:MAG: ArsR family transcriptional regulator, partial [Hyphomicrobiales bacterium]|nr:ArsR family transcriptional regulator [Hyphomicrobiales bacterium]